MQFDMAKIIDISKARHLNTLTNPWPTGLTEDELKYKCYNNWYWIDNKWQYFKKNVAYVLLLNELLGAYLTPSFRLQGLENKIVKRNNSIGLLSPNFRQPGEIYISPQTMIDNYTASGSATILEGLKKSLRREPSNEGAMHNTLDLISFDFYMHHTDRHNKNYFYKYNVNHILVLAHIFDCDKSFLCTSDYVTEDIINWWSYDNFIAKIYKLNKHLKNLEKRYPYFHDISLTTILNVDLDATINKIEEDFSVEIDKETKDKCLVIDEWKKKFVKTII